jgi:hypothetical protein
MTIEYSEETAMRLNLIGDREHSSLSRFLDTNGDGSGTKDMNAAAATYYIAAVAGEAIVIDEIVLTIADVGLFTSGLFGALAALANGCLLNIVRVRGGSTVVVRDLLDGIPLKTNADLFAIGDISLINDAAGSVCAIKFKHKPIRLESDTETEERLVFTVRDDLSGLTLARVLVKATDYVNTLD